MSSRWPLLLGLIFLVTLSVASIGFPVQAASAVDLEFPFYGIDVWLQPDGSALVLETIELQSAHDLHELDLLVDYSESGSIAFQSISINMISQAIGQTLFIEASPAGNAGAQASPATYELIDNGRQLQIRLYTALAQDTTRVLRLTYRLDNAVTLQRDAALFRGRFFSSFKGSPMMLNYLNIYLPERLASSAQSWSLPVSLADYRLGQSERDEIRFLADSQVAGQDLLLVSLLPIGMFGGAPAAADPLGWESLAAEARQMQAALEQSRTTFTQAHSLMFILIGVAFILMILIYWFFDREGPVRFKQDFWREMPQDTRPAVLAVLLNNKRTSRLILSTLVDLARRGCLVRHGRAFELLDQSLLDAAQDDSEINCSLAAYERYLLQWLFGDIAKGSAVAMTEIRRLARDPQKVDSIRVFHGRFHRLLHQEIAGRHLMDVVRSQNGRLVGIAAAGVYVLLAVLSMTVLRAADGYLLLLPAAGLAIYSAQIRRFTPLGLEIRAVGRALRRTIRQAGAETFVLEDSFYQDMLPLAIGLGLDGRLLEKMGRHQGDDTAAQALAADLRSMESTLSASLLLSAEFGW